MSIEYVGWASDKYWFRTDSGVASGINQSRGGPIRFVLTPETSIPSNARFVNSFRFSANATTATWTWEGTTLQAPYTLTPQSDGTVLLLTGIGSPVTATTPAVTASTGAGMGIGMVLAIGAGLWYFLHRRK